jgi:hypothetical protein
VISRHLQCTLLDFGNLGKMGSRQTSTRQRVKGKGEMLGLEEAARSERNVVRQIAGEVQKLPCGVGQRS